MLRSAQRLRRGSEFNAAVRGGRRAGRGAVVVHLVQPDERPGAETQASGHTRTQEPVPAGAESTTPARAGFIVPKAVGSAVVRNKVRRRLRHLVRERLAALPPGSMLVVRALPGAADVPYSQLASDLDAALAAARAPRRQVRQPR